MSLQSYKMYLRPALFLTIAVAFYPVPGTWIWVAFVLLAVFYFAVDVLNVDKSDGSPQDLVDEYAAYETGVLDRYVLDSTDSYGLFVSLRDQPVFIDIREDKHLKEREEFAHYLSSNVDQLAQNLEDFIESHPEFAPKQIIQIGLHARVLDQGEVFWTPDGYTLLKGLEFVAE